MTVRLIQGDCLEVLRTLAPQSIDAIITDLPYGTTACSWDEVIPFAPMWAEVKRLLKPRGAFVTTASQPFTSKLVMSNAEWFRYEWIWDKNGATGFLDANRRPLRRHENVLVFAGSQTIYNPVKWQGKPYKTHGVPREGKNYEGYNAHVALYKENDGERYPTSIVEFRKGDTREIVHPTQKPVALYEYLIRTYTNEGDTVLDFTMGSGTTGVACVKTGRNFIGIELDPGYFAIAERRISEAQMQMPLLEMTL